MTRWLMLILTAGALAGAGCDVDPATGYTTASMYPEDVQTVAVDIFYRGPEVYRRDLETRLTESIIKRIQLDTPFRVVDKSNADTLLEGVIVSVDQRTLSWNPRTEEPRDIQLRITVDYRWTDLRTGEIRVERKNFRAAGVYYYPEPLSEDFFEGSQGAIETLAERMVQTMESPW